MVLEYEDHARQESAKDIGLPGLLCRALSLTFPSGGLEMSPYPNRNRGTSTL